MQPRQAPASGDVVRNEGKKGKKGKKGRTKPGFHAPPKSGVQMSGLDLLQSDDQEVIGDLLDELLLIAADAREDIGVFFEFVMREERSRSPIKTAPHQRVIFKFIKDHDRCGLILPVGHSKCHGAGTQILMADGSTRVVEDVRVGDFVMGPSGPKRVTHTSSGVDDLFRVVPIEGSRAFTVNAEHLLTLVHTESGEVIDIEVQDYLSKSEWFQSQHKLFRVGVERFVGEEELPLDPYFLGVWFGDGNHSVRGPVKITNADEPVREACACIADQYGLVVTPNQDTSFTLAMPGGKRSMCGKAKGTPNPLMAKLRDLVGDSLSMESVRLAPAQQRREFLAGLIDTDGNVKDNCVYLTQKRSDWIDVVEHVARSLNISVTRTTVENPTYGTYHSVCLYGAVDQIPTRVERRRLFPCMQKKNPQRTGFRVEPIGEGRYYGFTVGGDGRYLLGDFTVTHNTFCLAAYTLWSLGRDPTMRGAIISATQGQAEKVVAMVRDYIMESPELHLVFPNLRQSTREGDHWTQTQLVVERPPGIRDYSLVAIGMDGQIMGSRFNWAIVDDMLNAENTRTKEGCIKVRSWVDSALRSRMDPDVETKLVISNTPWNPDDLVMTCWSAGWAMLKMDATGNIFVQDDVERVRESQEKGEVFVPWDCDDLRPAFETNNPKHPLFNVCRLVEHDPDLDNEKTLWPARINAKQLAKIRRTTETTSFLQSYMCQCRDNDSAWCKTEWIEECKQLARDPSPDLLRCLPGHGPVYGLTQKYPGPYQAFTGVDLAFSEKAKADDTAFFTFCVLPTGHRLILDIDIGKWNSPTVAQKIIQKHRDFNSIVIVEDVAAQKGVVQLIRKIATGIPIKGFTTTGAKKASVENGLPIIFAEIEQTMWLIPNDRNGVVLPLVQKWIDGLLNYQPSAHTSDSLMAMFFARDQARKFGLLSGNQGGGADLDFVSR